MSTNAEIGNLRDFKILASQETKGVQWPTMLFSFFVISATLLSTWLAVNSIIPLWLGFIINSFFMTQGYTAVHECAHQSIHGRHQRLRWLNEVFGVAGFFFTLHSFTMHKLVHRLHHTYTNDPEKDADAYVSNAPNVYVAALRALNFYFYTNVFMFKIMKLAPDPLRFKIRVFLETAAPVALALWFVSMGYGVEVLVLWVLPAIMAFAGVTFFVDWIPHHVEDKTDPIKNTLIMVAPKTLLGRLFAWVYNFHNYHLVHHLVPSAPWYVQEKLYEQGKHVLKSEGARIKYEGGFRRDVKSTKPAAAL